MYGQSTLIIKLPIQVSYLKKHNSIVSTSECSNLRYTVYIQTPLSIKKVLEIHSI